MCVRLILVVSAEAPNDSIFNYVYNCYKPHKNQYSILINALY